MARRDEGGMTMFKARKELEALQEKCDRLQEKCKEYQVENEALRERLDKISKGERCIGEYCGSCKHAIKGTTFEYTTAYGTVVTFGGGKTLCALSAPCVNFEREECP